MYILYSGAEANLAVALYGVSVQVMVFYSAWDSTGLVLYVLYVLPRAEPEEVHTALARYIPHTLSKPGDNYILHIHVRTCMYQPEG